MTIKTNHEVDHESLEYMIRYWREFQNMVAASPMWLPDKMRRAQAESWARANVKTGDPRFD